MPVRTLPCLIAALAFAGALSTAPAQAASGSAAASPSAKSANKQKSHSVRFIRNPNQETSAERERRLLRECKGRPNAGACLGYAS